ncbi:hypothetical protein N665_0566s0007 [Sinapis alba]|nr:hypothetical protein N665_0566s0007 [Sinapis alba]
MKAFSEAVALSSILLSSPMPAVTDILGVTPYKESKQFAKREKQQIKKLESSLKLYAPESAPALALNAQIEKTKRSTTTASTDGLPHLIVNGDQRYWGEFITPGLLFLYIAGWIRWVGRSYLIAISDDKKPAMKEIIIDVPLASRLIFRGFIWPVAAYRALLNGDLICLPLSLLFSMSLQYGDLFGLNVENPTLGNEKKPKVIDKQHGITAYLFASFWQHVNIKLSRGQRLNKSTSTKLVPFSTGLFLENERHS